MIQPMSMYRHMLMKKFKGQKALPYSVMNYYNLSPDRDLNINIDSAEYVVLDTELTGLHLKKDSVVSLGAVKVTGRKIHMGETFYRVVEPRTKLTGKSIVIHGITPSEASECPDIGALLPEFLDFCGDRIIVGHFVGIDIAFINIDMKQLYGFGLLNPSIDTLKLYMWIREKEEEVCAFHGGLCEDINLFSLARKYNIPVSRKHNALDDAFITAQLFQRLISFLPRHGVRTVKDLLKAGNR